VVDGGDGGRLGFGKRLGAVEQSCIRWGLSFTKGGDAMGGGGEIRLMAVVGNFVEIGKGGGSFVTNKLK
jgi:hypothetical protein